MATELCDRNLITIEEPATFHSIEQFLVFGPRDLLGVYDVTQAYEVGRQL